jgi:hypothetical protein
MSLAPKISARVISVIDDDPVVGHIFGAAHG